MKAFESFRFDANRCRKEVAELHKWLAQHPILDEKQQILRWLREVAVASPQSEMEVVMYARGLGLVMPERSSKTDEVKQALGNPRVSFKVCEIAMKNQNVAKSQLLPNVMTVPDGIGEIVSKQNQGWGYIKVGH